MTFRLFLGCGLVFGLVAAGCSSDASSEPEFEPPLLLFDEPGLLEQCEFPPSEMAEPVCHATAAELSRVLRALRERPWGEDLVAAARRRMIAAVGRSDWSPQRCMSMAQEQLPGAVHVLDTGNFTVLGEHLLVAEDFREVLGTPNGRFLGAGIGCALGAAAALPERPVVLWIGDGGIRAFLSELAIAADLHMKLCVCVMSDGFYGSIRGRAEASRLDLAAESEEVAEHLRWAASMMGARIRQMIEAAQWWPGSLPHHNNRISMITR